ncbi:unnamed protein product [Lymnaea stagnalis]|uniref:Pre-rRNA-processing protein TSR2 homolog n=1 Tax=Lymnaea stagnalis TaxID=6523 RepID=A0AAV2HME8_LYMST
MAMASSISAFGNAVSQILNSWTALQLAVEHGFGGSESLEKAKWMVYAIETWFTENVGVESDEVEDFLEDVLNTEFDLIVEDNSVHEISRLLCLYYRLCQDNKLEELQERLKSLPKASIQGCRKGNENDDEIDFDETDADSSSSSSIPVQPTVYQSSSSVSENPDDMEVTDDKPAVEDGWQVITRNKNKK